MDKGAHYHRCDFQVHTPRDLGWQGKGAVTDQERRSYAEEFVAACRGKGLDAVAITDHHDVTFFQYLKEAAGAETDAAGQPIPLESRLVVFPGMELTLGVPCQALILFDANFPTGLLRAAAESLSIALAADDAAKHAQVVRLEHIKSFGDLHARLNQREFLRGRYIVLPNVSDGGTTTLLRSGFATHYKEMPCVGGYVDGSVDQHGVGNAAIVAGKNKEYGNKPLGVFQTSDNRRRDFLDLGTHSTWVKWAAPTAEALRQACLARESRLSQSEPPRPSAFVTALLVSNSHFLGPVALELNPQYNAVIGGRGTGKSTLLEYLRWGLCDEPAGLEDDDLDDVHRRRRALVQRTLVPNGAVVEVSFLVNDIAHVVRRRASTGEVLLKIANEEFRSCTEADVRELLPVHAYSQKQLSSVSVRLDELNRFVHAPIQRELVQLRAEREELRTKLRAAYEDVRRQQILTAEIAKSEIERTSLGAQLEQLRGNLKGLSEADRQLIADQSLHDQEQTLIESWEGEILQTRLAIQVLVDAIAGFPSHPGDRETPNKAQLLSLHAELDGLYQRMRSTIAALSAGLDPNAAPPELAAFATSLSNWWVSHKKSVSAYRDAKSRSAAQETTLEQIRQVEDRLRQLELQASDRKRALQKLSDPKLRFQQLRTQWLAVEQRRANLVEQQCSHLTTLSKGLIRAKLNRGHGVEAVDQLLRTALRGTKVRGERYEALWQRIRAATDTSAEWARVLDELEVLASATIENEAALLPPTPTLEGADFTTRDRLAIARTLTPEGWLGLLLEGLEDQPEFEYQSRESDYIKFSDASAGQQATALMFALLNQPGPPLVIDQPEDDLDNKVIDQIVREIWRAKCHRQLIFSSHNANLVVNGDAELIVCCDYRVAGDQSGGKIKLEGAIDIPEINEEITLVMEGGRDAFALRRAKYGF